MGITKSEVFTDYQNSFAAMSKALGHPARIAIIQFLMNREDCVCGDIVDELNLAQSTISQHLKALKKEGIIQGTIDGTSVCYCLNPNKIKHMQALYNAFFVHVANQLKCC